MCLAMFALLMEVASSDQSATQRLLQEQDDRNDGGEGGRGEGGKGGKGKGGKGGKGKGGKGKGGGPDGKG